MKSVTLSSKNQVVIPKNARDNMKLHQGDILYVDKITKDSVTFKKAPSYHDLIGIIPSQQTDATKRIRKIRDNWQD